MPLARRSLLVRLSWHLRASALRRWWYSISSASCLRSDRGTRPLYQRVVIWGATARCTCGTVHSGFFPPTSLGHSHQKQIAHTRQHEMSDQPPVGSAFVMVQTQRVASWQNVTNCRSPWGAARNLVQGSLWCSASSVKVADRGRSRALFRFTHCSRSCRHEFLPKPITYLFSGLRQASLVCKSAAEVPLLSTSRSLISSWMCGEEFRLIAIELDRLASLSCRRRFPEAKTVLCTIII